MVQVGNWQLRTGPTLAFIFPSWWDNWNDHVTQSDDECFEFTDNLHRLSVM